jgi:hypothetical protein
MRNPTRALLVPVAAALALVACGSGSGTSSDTTAPEAPATTATTTAPASSAGDVATTLAPPTTGAASTPSEPPATDEPASGDAMETIVNVDDPTQVGQTYPVALGQTVVLRLLSDTDQEYHVHVVDLEKQTAAGVEATFEFTADTPGPIEVESHNTGVVLATLQVA